MGLSTTLSGFGEAGRGVMKQLLTWEDISPGVPDYADHTPLMIAVAEGEES